MDAVSEKLEQAVTWFCMFLICLFTVLLFVGVVMRYGFGATSSITSEISREVFVILTFLMAGVLWKHSSHLTMDMLFQRFGSRSKFALEIVFHALALFTVLLWLYGGVKLAQVDLYIGSETLELQLPWLWFHSFFIVGAVIFLFYVVASFVALAARRSRKEG